jgi:hypothetical protein
MARINGANLTLTTVGNNVTVNVTYTAGINALEHFLMQNGLVLQERIAVLGVDPPGSTTGAILHNFPAQALPVPAGAGPQTIARNRSLTVTRASLQEDAGVGDNDEIRCRITIQPLLLPITVTGFTDQEILLG